MKEDRCNGNEQGEDFHSLTPLLTDVSLSQPWSGEFLNGEGSGPYRNSWLFKMLQTYDYECSALDETSVTPKVQGIPQKKG